VGVVTDRSRVSGLDAGVFVAELALVAAMVYAGAVIPTSTLGKVLAAIALPVMLGVVWGRWLAPRANRPLPPRTALAAKIALFALASVLLALAGPLWLAAVFLLVTEILVVAAERARWRRT
jgi:Protein of unknown function (DUF2568)